MSWKFFLADQLRDNHPLNQGNVSGPGETEGKDIDWLTCRSVKKGSAIHT